MKKQKILSLLSTPAICFFFISFLISTAAGQRPPEDFFKALELFKTDKVKAKQEFFTAVRQEPSFHGSYHFLGVIYSEEQQPDSAIHYFKRSLALNESNTNHTREMTCMRLMETYLFKHDFNNAFAAAWDAYIEYPLNNQFARRLKDICLWSVYIRHNDFDPAYLSAEIKKEYVVNSVPQEYLILRTVKVNDESLRFGGQSLISKEGSNYDVLHCSINDTAKTDLYFKLNWDFFKDLSGRSINTKKVYGNKKNPVCERIGALLIADAQIDLKKEVGKIKDP